MAQGVTHPGRTHRQLSDRRTGFADRTDTTTGPTSNTMSLGNYISNISVSLLYKSRIVKFIFRAISLRACGIELHTMETIGEKRISRVRYFPCD